MKRPPSAVSVLSLVAFALAIIPVLWPFRIPIWARRHFYLDLNLVTSPWLATIFLLATRSISPSTVWSGLVGTQDLQPYSIMVLFYSIAYICLSLDATGFLKYSALWCLKRAGRDGRRVFLFCFLLTSIGSALASNDAVILTATSFLIHFAQEAKVEDPRAFLMAEFTTANIASMAIYVVGELEDHLRLSVIDATVNTEQHQFLVAKEDEDVAKPIIMQSESDVSVAFNPEAETSSSALQEIPSLRRRESVRVSEDQSRTPQSRFASKLQEFGKWHSKKFPVTTKVLSRLPWPILPFALGMFVLVEALSATGWLELFARALATVSRGFVPAIFVTTFFTIVLCSLINNLPAAILLARILLHPVYLEKIAQGTSEAEARATRNGALYALVAGANLGACLAIPGSLAGIMWERIVRGMD
ncbi:hypothetical protein HDU96_007258, partial [Phlyctochytrium bullatum]